MADNVVSIEDYERANKRAADAAARRAKPRILTGADFIKRHVPPVWLIDGVVQRGRLYACTSLTGHGKTAVWLFNACMIAAGRMIGQISVFPGNVLILAGDFFEPRRPRKPAMGSAWQKSLQSCRSTSCPSTCCPATSRSDEDEDEADALRAEISAIGVPFALDHRRHSLPRSSPATTRTTTFRPGPTPEL